MIEQVTGMIPEGWEIYLYRTSAGAEIDLLLFDEKRRPVAIEIKYSLSPTVMRGFWNAWKDISCRRGYVVYPGEESYPLGDGVSALPVKDLIKIVEER